MTLPSGPQRSFGTPFPEATARPPRAVAIGEIAYIHADKGFMVTLPDGTQKRLAGCLVLILDERFDTVNGKRSRLLMFRPVPWEFPESAYPNAWWAAEEYFSVIQR